MDDWQNMTAADLGRGIAAGRIDPLALTEAFLDAAAAHPLAPRIYARLTPGRARAEAGAAAARARAGRRRGPLDGVPLSWKDLYDTAGTGTEAGSALLAGRVPGADAAVLANATAAGLVCLGKTHMSELAFSGLGLNPITATAPCVHDADAVAGGSSSGAAASVAFGLAPGAAGSDTGGSVRVPAAWNDLVGVKTTPGALPMEGIVPLCPSFDTLGPLVRSVEDAALVLAAMAGAPAPDLAGATLRGARLAVLGGPAAAGLRAGPARGLERALAGFAAAGATLHDLAPPAVAEALDLAAILYTPEAYGVWKDTIEAAPERMFPPILDRFRAGAHHSAPDFVAAWRRLDGLRAEWAAAVAGFDAVVLATTPNAPPDIARLMSEPDYYVTENLLTLRNTRIGNLFGLPAATLPTGEPSAGVMLMGRPGGGGALLRLAAAAEAALAAR